MKKSGQIKVGARAPDGHPGCTHELCYITRYYASVRTVSHWLWAYVVITPALTKCSVQIVVCLSCTVACDYDARKLQCAVTGYIRIVCLRLARGRQDPSCG